MLLILRVENGPGAGRNCTLRSGQRVRVGSTARADFSVPTDLAMADEHFEIWAGSDRCTLQTCGSATVQLNGIEASQGDLTNGDKIVAGSSTFAISLEGGVSKTFETEAEGSAEETPVTSGFVNIEQNDAAAICSHLKLSPPAAALAQPGLTPAAYVDVLQAEGLARDALYFMAAALPAKLAVDWACQCMARSAGESPPLAAAQLWAAEPSDDALQAAVAAAELDGPATPTGFLAMAVGYTGELAPNVPAPPGLLGKAIKGALELAVAGDDALRDDFLAAAINIAQPEV